MGEKKVGIQAPGPPRRDPGRNSEPDAGFKVPNGATATHLVAKRCDLGSLGVPCPASTPLGALKLGKPGIVATLKTWIGISSKYFENRGMCSNYFEEIPPAPPSAAPSGRRRARRRGYFFKIV